MRVLALFILLGLLYSPAIGAEQPNEEARFRSFIDGATCGQVIQNLDKPDSRKEFALMVGSFISGTNYTKKRDSKIDLRGMLMIAEQFCRKNPKKSVTSALIHLDSSVDKRMSFENKAL